jgi:hypothetical protein
MSGPSPPQEPALSRKNDHRSPGHPLATGSLSNTIRLIRRNGGIDGRYLPRALKILLSNLVLTPLRRKEIRAWANAVENAEIREPPVFIIGTWRSGTTHLHNLMALDGQFGFVSTLQAFCPDLCTETTRFLRPALAKLLPKKRPMDNMAMALESPQEEEYAVGNLSPHSFYHGYFLPRSMPALFDRLSFDHVEDGAKNAWMPVYLRVLKKATLISGGKKLILKNPLNTVRIPVLLEMFPAARFIFLYRNPGDVFHSILHTFASLTGAFRLERVSRAELEENVFRFYEKMMRRYWSTRESIPAGGLIEIRFEDFESRPLATLERIYLELGLAGFEPAKGGFERYIASQRGYEKNRYVSSPETDREITRRWRFAFEKLGYPPPGGTAV